MDCNFDQGACEWVQDKDDDMDWGVAYHTTGNKMMIYDDLWNIYEDRLIF